MTRDEMTSEVVDLAKRAALRRWGSASRVAQVCRAIGISETEASMWAMAQECKEFEADLTDGEIGTTS